MGRSPRHREPHPRRLPNRITTWCDFPAPHLLFDISIPTFPRFETGGQCYVEFVSVFQDCAEKDRLHMAIRRSVPTAQPPTISPERAYAAITKQLASLNALRSRDYREAEQEESQWKQFTESVLEHSFGKPSTALSQFYSARSAGSYRMAMYGEVIPHSEHQHNFQQRLDSMQSCLKARLSELELQMPEKEIQGHYDPGQQYEFYRDIKAIMALAGADVLVVDAYLGLDMFDLYAQGLNRNTTFRVLTNKLQTDVQTVAQKYAAGGNLQLRTSHQIHDRLIFIGNRVWLIGQSIKDGAKNKPTYVIENDATAMSPTYEAIWGGATIVI